MVVKIVIGANFGDEGKGLMTDYFCHQSALRGERCLTILHNGGAQRGHTVVTLDGERHVFHHFGSGTFAGAGTYLSMDFILNPMVFRKEWSEIEKLGYTPRVYASRLCRVSTPYDMIANQIIEEARSGNRHGSCGIGIYETMTRYASFRERQEFFEPENILKYSYQHLRNTMIHIREYFIKRIHDAGIELSNEWKEILYSESLIQNYIDDLRFMASKVPKMQLLWILFYDCVVFEGGQGLLLDQNNKKYFPHLTPSNTGIENPLKIISNICCKPDVEVCYVTRTYLTRHGAGRLDGECDKAEINPDMQDLTNVPNPHQGTLRYAKLDEKSLEERILKDFKQAKGCGAKISLAVTHENEYADMFSNEFREKFDCIYCSNGETRKSVRRLK